MPRPSSRPTRAPRSRPTGDAPALIKMSELARRSGVSAPTIKHYIREGLLRGPQIRTSRNMAYYDARLADRIRRIKALQAERFLPLRVIADLLEPTPSSEIKKGRDAEQRRALTRLTRVVEPARDQRRRTRAELGRTLGVTRRELEHLERTGVLALRGTGKRAGYEGADLPLLDVLARTRSLGLGAVFPTAIAEPYLAAVRALVALEIDIFRHRVLSGERLPAPLPEIMRHAVELGAELILGLRAKLLPEMLAAVPAAGAPVPAAGAPIAAAGAPIEPPRARSVSGSRTRGSAR
jgi:DNA-binding transcriptional MerR regulator